MKKNNLIILAGGEKGPLSEAFGCDNKALLPIHGKPMLDWVIEAFQKSGCIDKIVVVGSSELDALSSMQFVEKRIDSSSSLVRNILRGVAYIRWKYYRHNSDHAGYVITFCDAVFLTPEAIADAISNIQNGSHDLVLHYVEKETYETHAISAKRTYIPIDGKQYTGTTIYFVKKFSNLLSSLHLFGDLRKNRKDPKGLLRVMGLEDCTFPQIEERLSERIGNNVGVYVSEFPGMGMDVDKKSDFELAESLLSSPEGGD